MSVQFKAYLYEGRACRSKEIRRFSVDQDVSTSYEYLRRKVSNVFPNLAENFALQWRDSDGDLIWFNSDEELLQALSLHADGEFKLYIKEQSTDYSSQQSYGQKFCGPSYGKARCPPPFGFYPGFFPNCPFKFEPNVKDEPNSDKPSTSNAEEKQESPSAANDYLQEMGKAVAEFLKPFGIDVDINVEQNKSDSADATKPTETTSSDSDKPAEATKQSDPSSTATSQWTIINNEKAEEKSKGSEDQMEVDEDARIRESLDRLLTMGFNDDNGWLTNLLKSCKGDIGRALDAMQPNRSKKN